MTELAEVPETRLAVCHHCGELVPVGTFCGHCGAHLAGVTSESRSRHFAYAAAPHEPVARPSVVSTLFPHLPHRHMHIFRDLLIVGVVIVAILAALHLFTSATAAAALLLPILYVCYLYEVEVYERAPLLVIAATFVTGAVLGIVYSLLVPVLVHPSVTQTTGDTLVNGVLLPLIAQVLMIAGPLLLLGRREFDETLDGLTFGAASALGFTMTTIVAGYWHVLTAPVGGTAVALDEVLRLLRLGIFGALVNASTTALITSAIWLHRYRRGRVSRRAPWSGLTAAIVAGFGLQIVLGLLTSALTTLLAVVIAWGIGAAVALIALRIVVHHALLDEGAQVLMIGPPSACPECHHLVPTMLFCPVCGVARTASPKRPAPSATRPDRPLPDASAGVTP